VDDRVLWLQNSVHHAFDSKTNPKHLRTKAASLPFRKVLTNLKGKLKDYFQEVTWVQHHFVRTEAA
jgi:hypothetical protein